MVIEDDLLFISKLNIYDTCTFSHKEIYVNPLKCLQIKLSIYDDHKSKHPTIPTQSFLLFMRVVIFDKMTFVFQNCDTKIFR